jgi:hypothetical protein
MLTFEIAGEGYEASFRHTTKPELLEPGCRGTTECMVTRLRDGVPVGFAEARARVPDNFSRSLGRQISLGRVLLTLTSDKGVRHGIVRRVV